MPRLEPSEKVITLPFFSSGGTSIVMLLAEIGVLLAISRESPNKVM